MSRPSTIAIDGPGAVGKNAVGHLLAARLGYRFLDTGAMYRALTWLALKRHIDLGDEKALSELGATVEINLAQYSAFIDGRDVTEEIRGPEVENSVSLVAKVAGVRRVLETRQRTMAQGGRVVMVGRDIGTVILPDAELKIYLTASPEERARRRYKELREQGQKVQYAHILAELRRRDTIDSERALSPLRPAEDAIIIDTNELNLEEVLAKILTIIGEN